MLKHLEHRCSRWHCIFLQLHCQKVSCFPGPLRSLFQDTCFGLGFSCEMKLEEMLQALECEPGKALKNSTNAVHAVAKFAANISGCVWKSGRSPHPPTISSARESSENQASRSSRIHNKLGKLHGVVSFSNHTFRISNSSG